MITDGAPIPGCRFPGPYARVARASAPALAELAVQGLLALALLPGLACAWFWAVHDLQEVQWASPGNLRVLLPCVALAMGVWYAVMALARRERPVAVVPFLLVAVVSAFLLRMAYLLAVDITFTSDFRSYWNAATKLAEMSDYAVKLDGYRQRAVPFLLPLVELTDGSVLALKVMNNAFLALVSVLGYDILRRIRSHQSAQAFLVLFAFTPEPALSAAIPSHDLTGMALYAAGLWLMLQAWLPVGRPWTRWPLLVATGAGLGLVLMLVEMSRGAGSGAFLALCGVIAGVLFAFRRRPAEERAHDAPRVFWRRFCLLLLVALPVMAATLWVASQQGLRVPKEHSDSMRARFYMSTNTALSNGSYGFLRRYFDRFGWDLMKDPPALQDEVKSIALSEFAERPVERVLSSYSRLPALFALGSRLDVYLPSQDRAAQPLVKSVYRYAKIYNYLFVFVFSLALIICVLRLLSRPLDDPTLLAHAVCLGAMTLLIVMLIPVSPRYMYPIWYLGSIIVAAILPVSVPSTVAWGTRIRIGAAKTLVVILASVLGFWLLYRVADTLYGVSDGRVLTDWRFGGSEGAQHVNALRDLQASRTDLAPGGKDYRGREVQRQFRHVLFGPLSVKLALPAAPHARQATAQTLACLPVGADRTTLSFLYQLPRSERGSVSDARLAVLVDGKERWAGGSQGTAVKRVRIPDALAPGTCTRVAFMLRSFGEGADSSGAIDAEIFHARLIAGNDHGQHH